MKASTKTALGQVVFNLTDEQLTDDQLYSLSSKIIKWAVRPDDDTSVDQAASAIEEGTRFKAIKAKTSEIHVVDPETGEILVRYFPHSEWASGKIINDGRGLDNLIQQLKEAQ